MAIDPVAMFRQLSVGIRPESSLVVLLCPDGQEISMTAQQATNIATALLEAVRRVDPKAALYFWKPVR